MNKDQAIGAVLLVASIVGIVVYAWLLLTYTIIVLQVTAFVAIAAVLVILAWIGWTMATTPPPAPLQYEPVLAEEKANKPPVLSVTKAD